MKLISVVAVALFVAAILLLAPRCQPDSGHISVGSILLAGCR